MSTEIDMFVEPTSADRSLWDAMLAEAPEGVRVKAIRWRDGSFQVQADLPANWHRAYSQIARTAVGNGPTLAAAAARFRSDLRQIRAELGEPGQALYVEYMCPNCVTPWKCNGPHIPEPPR